MPAYDGERFSPPAPLARVTCKNANTGAVWADMPMSAPHRGRDLVDVQELIHKTKLPRDLANELDPYVRAKFLELWDLAQHPDDDY